MIRKLILSLCVGFCCLACEEALPDYNTTWSGVQFVLGETLNPERFSYSFIRKEETRMMDTIWFTVRPQGLLPERSSRIRLEQYEGKEWKYIYGEDGAIVDFCITSFSLSGRKREYIIVAFDDERMAEYLTLEPGELEAKIPVIVMRDRSLQDTTFTLFFHIVDSEDLKAGDEKYCNIQLGIADCLTRPALGIIDFLRVLGVKLVMSS